MRSPQGAAGSKYKTATASLADADTTLTDLFEATRSYLRALGDDVQERTLKNYFAFTRLKNFACIEIKPTARKLLVYLKVDPVGIDLRLGFTRDVSNIGHYGAGDLEVTIAQIRRTSNVRSPSCSRVTRRRSRGIHRSGGAHMKFQHAMGVVALPMLLASCAQTPEGRAVIGADIQGRAQTLPVFSYIINIVKRQCWRKE